MYTSLFNIGHVFDLSPNNRSSIFNGTLAGILDCLSTHFEVCFNSGPFYNRQQDRRLNVNKTCNTFILNKSNRDTVT